MIIVKQDYNGFAIRFSDFLEKKGTDTSKIRIVPSNDTKAQICDASSTPFACNPTATFYGDHIITYNLDLIKKIELTPPEIDACILHEIGHFIYSELVSGYELEVACDKIAVEANQTSSLISALLKIQDKLKIDLHKRINNLYSLWHIYRPEWTCGRYNNQKQAGIMYNLIAGFSYYFDSYSANVIGEILKVEKNEDINVESIASNTGIHVESLSSFFIQLTQDGLLTDVKPTKTSIHNYRKSVVEVRKEDNSWVDKPTKEKLPMAVSNAVQDYFSAVEDDKTICSCMFELTYRCSEMCIHCYNPGATRNSTEVSYRANQTELSIEDYRRIIDNMYDNGLVKVCLSGGDPFSKEIVWKLLDYLYLKGIAVDIFTNGQKIFKQVERLADYYPRLVGLSIYSGLAEVHDAITRIPGSWNKTMQVVKGLHEYAIPMHLKCCVMQTNLHSYYMVADIAKEYGAIPQFEINITESNDGDICAKQLRLTEEQLQVVLRDNNIALYVGKEAPNYGGVEKDLSSCSCGAGGTGFCMSPNGDMRGCVAFTQVYGNLKEQSVPEILENSKTLCEWRNTIIEDFTECGRHDYCDYCNLCAGINYTEHGDYLKPAETNCYMAKCRFNLAHKLMENDQSMTREEFIEALQKLPIEKVDLKRLYK